MYEVRIITPSQTRIRCYKDRRLAKHAYNNAKFRYPDDEIGLFDLETGEVINAYVGERNDNQW